MIQNYIEMQLEEVPMFLFIPIITERVSCGDEILYPSCSLCPKNAENPGNWCKGNCFIDSSTGNCKERGIEFHS